METDKSMQRKWFVASYLSGDWSMSELCKRFGISRPTGYLWVKRHDEEDDTWFLDKSRAPRACTMLCVNSRTHSKENEWLFRRKYCRNC